MNKQEQRYKYEVEKTVEYEYIRSYRKGDILPNGKIVSDSPYIQIKHKYCDHIYETQAGQFINIGKRCSKCCGSYENSFAHHIEMELGLNINDVWDFDKNTVNPCHISKNMNSKSRKNGNLKIWVKCDKIDYHDSYEVACSDFVRGNRCPYCASKKTHPKDSFAQYHIDNTDPDFLEKYWDYEKNTLNPFTISRNSGNKVWIKCQEKDYHDSYEVACDKFYKGRKCPYCHPTGKKSKIHIYDSFGYNNFDKVMSWNNNISPFKVAKSDNNKYKFICETCGCEFEKSLANINAGQWCPKCSKSKGEKKIRAWIDCHNINYIHDEPYFDDLLSKKGNPLRPDFILPEHKIWIEYDGEFHYKDFYRDGSYELLKLHDKQKDIYAKKYGWELIRIPYWEFDNIEKILEKGIKNG